MSDGRKTSSPSSRFAALLLLAWLLSAGGSPADPVQAQWTGAKIPCNPSFTRTMDPLAVEQGGVADVEVRFDYDCRSPDEEVVTNVMLVINTAVPDGFNERAGLEKSLRAGMDSIINQMPWANGSKMGLILFDDQALVRSPLQADPSGSGGHRQALARLTQSLRLGTGSAAGFDDAIAQAYRQLPVLEEGEVNAIIAFHAGPQDLTVGNWCRQADRVGILLYGVQVVAGGGLLTPCMNAGMATLPNDGDGLEQVLEDMGNSLFWSDTIDRIFIVDYMNQQYIDFVPGSSNPPGSHSLGGGHEWELPGSPHPPGGRALTYQVEFENSDPSLAPDQLQVSFDADAFLRYASGIQVKVPLHVPEICLARPGKLVEDCGSYQTPTPTPRPSATLDLPTVEPSATATPGPASDTPAPTVTPIIQDTLTPTPIDTPVPSATISASPTPSGFLFMPLLLRSARNE